MGGLKASVFSLTALVALSAQQANALDLGCQYEWSGPSSGNDVGDCAKNYPSNNPGMLVPTAIPLFFTAVLLLTFPIIFLGRCCGLFGSNEQRPGAGCCCDGSEWDAESEDKKAKVYHSQSCQITMLKCGALLLVLMSISTVVLMPLGASKAVSSWNYMLDNVEPDIFKWLEDRRDEILTGVRNDDGTLPAPLTDDSFNVINDTLDDVRKIRDDVKDATNTAVEVLNYITYALCALPIVGMGLTLLFALCNCRRFCPACFQCVFYPLGIIYGLFGAVFITFGLSMFLVDGEVKLQEKALPGIFSWYILPYCESELGFEDIKTTITGAITEASENGCLKILDICDENPVIVDPMSTSEAQFYCPGLSQSTVPDRCNTPTDLMRLINTTYAKQGSYVCATGTFPALVPQNCSISECPDDCIDSQMQTTASEAITQVATGERVAKVLTRALLFADCDVLATQFIKPLADMHSGGEGFYYAGGGFSVGMLCFILAMLVLCKGQKVFVAEPSLEANSPVDFSDPKPW